MEFEAREKHKLYLETVSQIKKNKMQVKARWEGGRGRRRRKAGHVVCYISKQFMLLLRITGKYIQPPVLGTTKGI